MRSMQRMHDDAFVNLIRYGTVLSVQEDPPRLVAQVGEVATKPIPWLAFRAGATRHWSPPSPGEQVLLLSPGGNLGAATALTGLFSDQAPKPAEGTNDNVAVWFDDGAVLLYDRAAHLLKATLPGGGRVELNAPGGFRLVGDVDVEGKFHVTREATFDATLHAAQDVTTDADVKAGDISLRDHPHGDVQKGGDLTGKPLP
jgi:phage baseplate assembly protein V